MKSLQVIIILFNLIVVYICQFKDCNFGNCSTAFEPDMESNNKYDIYSDTNYDEEFTNSPPIIDPNEQLPYVIADQTDDYVEYPDSTPEIVETSEIEETSEIVASIVSDEQFIDISSNNVPPIVSNEEFIMSPLDNVDGKEFDFPQLSPISPVTSKYLETEEFNTPSSTTTTTPNTTTPNTSPISTNSTEPPITTNTTMLPTITTTTLPPFTTTTTELPSTTPRLPHTCDIVTPNPDLAPVYLKMLNEYESALLPKDMISFTVTQDMTIVAICPSTFAHNPTLTIITVQCSVHGYLFTDTDYFYGKFICAKSDRSELYEKRGDTECPKTYYAIGLNISGQIIIYAESCYDTINFEVSYVHYRAIKPSEFVSSYIPEIFVIDNNENANWFSNNKGLDKIKDKNVVKRSIQPVTNQFLYKTIQDAVSQVYSKVELPTFKHNYDFIQSEIKRILKEAHEHVVYQEVNLFTPDTYEPFVQNPFKNHKILNTVFGWNNLIHGNWKLFQKLLQLQSTVETLEIYMGTSHSVEVPIITPRSKCLYPLERSSGSEIRNELKFEENGITVTIPKYIWTYIKSVNPINSFVVIGVNSPYYEYFTDTYFPCNDVCDGIEWLKNLEKFKQYDVFGKILCCPVNDVKDILKGFPIML